MNFNINNKTILIAGVVVALCGAVVTKQQDIALAAVSGLVGYLSKDITMPEKDTIEEVVDDENGA